MLELKKVIPPHLGNKILFAGNDFSKASKALIMIHGRGSNAESILSLSQEIPNEDVIFIAPEANEFRWYPYRFIDKRENNEPGISSGLVLIDSIISSLIDTGFTSTNIFLMGFSQGACLVLDYAARYPQRLGGVIALSGGLIGDFLNPNDYKGNLEKTPIFIGCSTNDFHIPEVRVHESAEIFTNLNAEVTKKLYPGMGHTINSDEISIINSILSKKS